MRIKPLQLSDLATLASLRSWCKKSIKIHEKYVVNDTHLLIYLDYIAKQVKENNEITGQAWFEQIARLRKRLGNRDE